MRLLPFPVSFSAKLDCSVAPSFRAPRVASVAVPRALRRLVRRRGAACVQAQGVSDFGKEDKDELKFRFPPGLGGLSSDDLPTQGRSVVEGTRSTAVAERDPSGSDQDYLSVRTTTPTTPQGCGHPRTRACILGDHFTGCFEHRRRKRVAKASLAAPAGVDGHHAAGGPTQHRVLWHAQHGV